MEACIISSSPNTDGLTAACVEAVRAGLAAGGVGATEVRLTEAGIGVCRQCGDGWGTCREGHTCQVSDGFQAVHARVRNAAALVLVTPVYWGDLSESAKAFTDRLRRCEATLGEHSTLAGTWFMGAAAAGGSGGGQISCLEQMERLLGHMRMKRWDLVSLCRWTREAKLQAITASARTLAQAVNEER